MRSRFTNALKEQNNIRSVFLSLTPSPDNLHEFTNQMLPSNLGIAETCQTEDVSSQYNNTRHTSNTDTALQAKELRSDTDNCNQRTYSPQQQALQLFSIHHEQNVPPLATESGGSHYRLSHCWPTWMPKTTRRECHHCNRIFKRKTDYTKHYRRCHAIHIRYCKSMITTRRKSMYQCDAASVTSEISREQHCAIEIPTRPPISTEARYQCAQCSARLVTLLQFRKHTLLHRKQYNCDICGLVSTSRYIFDFHRAECFSKFEAKKEVDACNKRSKKKPARRKTRAYSLHMSLRLGKIRSDSNSIDQLNNNESRDNRAETNGYESSKTKENTLIANSQSWRRGKRTFRCRQCNRKYKIRHFYEKHIGHCKSDGAKQVTSVLMKVKTLSVQCLQCNAAFQSEHQLRGHMRIHPKHYSCCVCGQQFRTQEQLNLHRKTDCQAESCSNDSGDNQVPPARHTTRLYSRLLLEDEFKMNDDEDGTKSCNTSNGIKRNNCDQESNLLNANLQISKKKESLKINRKEINASIIEHSANSIISSKKSGQQREFNDDNETTEDESDNDSLADSLLSRRQSFIKRWLDEHTNSSNRSSSLYNNGSFDPHSVPTQYRYLHLLERLRHEVKTRQISCYEPNCEHRTSTLNYMLIHDYIDHFKKPRFFCHKCGDCFTSKAFLDYHLDIQDRDHNYRCYKCGMCLPKQRLLHQHLWQHEQQTPNEIAQLKCHGCNMVFLDANSRQQHYENNVGHDSRTMRKLVEIEHFTTNTLNSMERPTVANSCSIQILEVHSTPCRPRRLVSYGKRYKPNLRMGIVQFKESVKANCVGI